MPLQVSDGIRTKRTERTNLTVQQIAEYVFNHPVKQKSHGTIRQTSQPWQFAILVHFYANARKLFPSNPHHSHTEEQRTVKHLHAIVPPKSSVEETRN